MSRIGKKPVAIPSGIKVEIKDNKIYVEGPKGKLNRELPSTITAVVTDNNVVVDRKNDEAKEKALHGLMRALINNMIIGVVSGYCKELEIIGVGFKAQVQGKKLTLTLGFSHPVVFEVPEGITIEAPKNTLLIIKGIDKERVGEISAEIRSVYPPEPYKGKGIRYVGEVVKKKVGKAQAAGKGK